MFALIGAAAIFDIYHSTDPSNEINKKDPVNQEAIISKIIYCNQIPTFNLKTAGSEVNNKFSLSYSHDKFLIKHYNHRTFQIMKAESLLSFFPVIRSFSSLPFNRDIYSSPDDPELTA